MEMHARTWFTPKQRAELWERWKSGQCAHVATTARYAHLDNDPLRRASETIAGRIAAALEGDQQLNVLPLRGHAYGA
jgi:hypothetical protein